MGQVHSGFLDCWRSLARPMLAELRTLRAAHPLAAVHVTGHSLGAATPPHRHTPPHTAAHTATHRTPPHTAAHPHTPPHE